VTPARVRFAPSPTGFLHVGGARTALYNWLVARSTGGVLILRSDDTDVERSTAGYYDDIVDGLRWLGLDWDEGIEVGGPHEPYRQSLRLERYRGAVDDLVSAGRAYRCFCAPQELEERRAAAMAEGRPPGYDGRCRALDHAESEARVAAGEEASVRLAVPRPGSTTFTDVVRGDVTFDHDHVDDFVILRSSGYPTYHLASTVDDVDFAITHVIRGEDLLSSTPKHILLGAALGRETPILYAHLSLLMGPDGRKLSKRHGDTALRAYREAGYLPEALVNYLALLGWSPGDDETIVHRDDMVSRFDLAKVSRNAAIFDTDKLQWMNGVYIRELDAADFVQRTVPLVEADLGRALATEERSAFDAVAPLVQERVKLLTEVPGQVRFLFADEVDFDDTSWESVMTRPEARVALEGAVDRLEALDPWDHHGVEEALREMLEERGLSARKGLQPVRVAITGSTVSPPLFESIAVLGKEATLRRLRTAFDRL
jgi:glutamyl-tRNA synthetase